MNGPSNRSAMVAAAIILFGTGFVFYFMPTIILALSEISPWLSYAVAILAVLAFFCVFWFRAWQNGRDDDNSGG